MQTPVTRQRRALDGITVLDLAGPLGNYCGKLFADLGAEVILIEPPSGAPTRHTGPYLHDIKTIETSLTYQYENTNKRSVVLDLDLQPDRNAFLRLASQAALIIESEKPGVMQQRELDYAALRAINTAIVMVSISPFGQDGPYADWLATDLTAMAMGGMLYLAGYPDTAPMVACGEQAVGAANLFAAVAALAAINHAEQTGSGQHVDVSMQECVVMGLENAVQFYDLEGTIRKRCAGTQRLAGTGAFRCQDGYIYLMAGGIGNNRFWDTTTTWLINEGLTEAEQFRAAQWHDQTYLASDSAKQIFHNIFAPFALAHTKAQLQDKGRTWRIPITPVYTAKDIAQDPQRAHRHFFVQTPRASSATLRMPGAPYRMSRTPWYLDHAAPTLGQHTAAVLTHDSEIFNRHVKGQAS